MIPEERVLSTKFSKYIALGWPGKEKKADYLLFFLLIIISFDKNKSFDNYSCEVAICLKTSWSD